MKHSTNTAVNWPVFQATAALYGGYVAAGKQSVSGLGLAERVDRSFIQLYRVMEQLAERIERENAAPANCSAPKRSASPAASGTTG